MPLLSIIIPVYNSSKLLRRCLDSIVGQTFTDWELILVDDGSTDDSLEICNQYKSIDSRITVIHKQNEGAGPTRNVGLSVANGKYITFPDSDDRMDTNAYQKCIQLLEKFDFDLLVFGMKTELFNDDLSIVESVVEDAVPEVIIKNKKDFYNNFKYLFSKMDLGSPCNKIYKHSIIKENNILFPDLRRMQDCVFNIYYYDCINNFCSINENYFIRTWHSNEFQRKKMPKDFLNCAISYFKTLTATLKKWNIYNDDNIVYFGEVFSEIIMTAEFDYLPSENPSFFELYSHIKKINSNRYLHDFYKQLSKYKRIRKKEYAMFYRLNLSLTLHSFLLNKMKQK